MGLDREEGFKNGYECITFCAANDFGNESRFKLSTSECFCPYNLETQTCYRNDMEIWTAKKLAEYAYDHQHTLDALSHAHGHHPNVPHFTKVSDGTCD
jgi:hypothetical protein